MLALPAADLRYNIATYAVPMLELPSTSTVLANLLPREPFDPLFHGQYLATTYFDTCHLDLWRARQKRQAYFTLRVRCYGALGLTPTAYALSVKTEASKWRIALGDDVANQLLAGDDVEEVLESLLPADMLARLSELTAGQPLAPAVTVSCRRYAGENSRDRLTLDVGVKTDRGVSLPFAVLEYKSVDSQAIPPLALIALRPRPVKLSKFLWALTV